MNKNNKRCLELDGLRGVAVIGVLVYHFWPTTDPWKFLQPITRLGWIGVDLFFVLSGFLITTILLDTVERPDYYRVFYLRRARRIWPLYYAFLGFSLCVLGLWQGGAYWHRVATQWASPFWFLVYLGNFISAQRGLPAVGMLAPLWSLQIEEQFYLVYPALLRRARQRLGAVLLSIIVLALVWRVISSQVFASQGFQTFDTLCRADGLAAGGLAALARRNPALRLSVTRFSAACAATLLFCFYAFVDVSEQSTVLRTVGYTINAITFAAIVLWMHTSSAHRDTRLFRFRPLVYMGTISYGVYVLQMPAHALVTGLHSQQSSMTTHSFSEFVLTVICTVVAASISWHCFERRFLGKPVPPNAIAKLPVQADSPQNSAEFESRVSSDSSVGNIRPGGCVLDFVAYDTSSTAGSIARDSET